MVDAIYRLPDPAKLDQVLRGTYDEQVNAARKLKGVIQKHWASLTQEQKGKVQTELGWSVQQVLDFLKKQDTDESSVGYFQKRWLRQLLEAIQKHGAADVTIQPGTQDKRPLTSNEVVVLGQIVVRIGQIVNEIKQKTHDTCLANVFGVNIIVIRSLATLNDAPVWANLTPNLTNGLPEPMKTRVESGGTNAVHVI